MQTRKRAKSVSFGKKHTEKDETEEVKHTVADEAVSSESNSASEKAEVVERRPVHEKPQAQELSDTPPKDGPEEEAPEVETPASEFVTDTPLSDNPESKESKEDAEEPAAAAEPAELSQSAEPTAQPGAAEQAPQGSEELSDTLPTSAFTIQTNSNEQPAQQAQQAASAPEGEGKKRFGLYFIVVAFLSFILGLGAMAAASYFGFFKGNIPALPTGVNVSTLLGHKPTPTPLPPTAVPTQKPVNLTAFTISVLNGSGISGKAADEKTALTTAGFKVTSTGNADNSNFTKTEIAAKKSVDPAFLKKLEDELGKSFTVDTSVTASPDSSPADVTVTLGSDTAK